MHQDGKPGFTEIHGDLTGIHVAVSLITLVLVFFFSFFRARAD
jgi:hypothetical protein